MKIKIAHIVSSTESEGPGKRFCMWVSGCSIKCEGCFNKSLWDSKTSKVIEVKDLFIQVQAHKDIEGITISGGEPFDQAEAINELVALCKKNNLGVICYTGYYLKDLKTQTKNIDLLIDGPFVQAKQDYSRPLIGSSNQNYNFLTDRYSNADILELKNTVEITIGRDNQITVNGYKNPL